MSSLPVKSIGGKPVLYCCYENVVKSSFLSLCWFFLERKARDLYTGGSYVFLRGLSEIDLSELFDAVLSISRSPLAFRVDFLAFNGFVDIWP